MVLLMWLTEMGLVVLWSEICDNNCIRDTICCISGISCI
jgi:hypothetical protein